MIKMPSHLAEIIDGNSGNVGATPCCDLAVSVLSDDKSVNRSAVDTKVLAQKIFKPCGIKNRT